ncbi:MAG: 3-oxoadipate enol-lactonase [Burkholderiaceae bacterium]
MSTQTVNANGINLNVKIDGAADAPWIVLSNSLGSNLAMWDDQIPFLTKKYRVLRYDTRGHGASSTPPGAYSFADLTGDVIALMDHFKIDKAPYMGLSMGGMTGMGLAIAYPQRFTGIICCDARGDAPDGFKQSWDDRAAVIRDQGMAALVDPTMERWLTAQCRAERPDDAKRLAAMVASTDPNGYIGCAMALKTLDFLKDMGGVTVPMLYVGGETDSGAMPDVMQAMADATPGSRYAMVANAAHIANVDNPAGFNAAIAQFLAI